MDFAKAIVLPVTLNGDNYLLWSRTTKTALCSRGLWSHVTQGVDPSEGEDGTFEANSEEGKWFQEDQTVLAVLQNSLEPSLLAAYSYCETAKDLWETLKKVYGNTSNISRIFEVKRALNTLQQEERPFKKHFGEYRALWAELEGLRPSTVDPMVLQERRDQDLVFGLLLSLNSSFNDLVRHILRSETLPNLNEVCMQIQKEEGGQGLFGQKDNLAMANKGVFKKGERRVLVCDHCKKKGHTQERCWILHPHLKQAKFSERKAFSTTSTGNANVNYEAMTSTVATHDPVTKSDLDKIFKSISDLKDSGMALNSFKNSKPIVIDSGASHNMIRDSNLITNVESAKGNVVIANGQNIPVKGLGDLKLFDKNTSAFYVPNFTSNLLSVRKVTNDLNCLAIFGPNNMWFQDIKTGKTLGEGSIQDGLYLLNSRFNNASNVALSTSLSTRIWHDRLGHPHIKALQLLLPNEKFENELCEACVLGKHCRSIFPISTTNYDNCFDLIHSDVWTAPCSTRDNLKYFVSFIDEKSKYTWITLLPNKGRVFEAFSNFCSYINTQYKAKIKVLRTDNGGEYMSNEFKAYTTKHGIMHQTSCPYTPQQNGVAERKNRHLMEVARTIMFHKDVPKRFWGDAVTTAGYLINRLPTKCLNDMSPFEVLNKAKPSINHLRVFGCVCFVFLSEDKRNKLEPRSMRCMFIGYSPTQKGYKCYNPETSQVHVSRNVKFDETKGYFGEKDWSQLRELARPQSDRATTLKFILDGLNPPQENHPPKTPSVDEEVSQDGEKEIEPQDELDEVIQEELEPSTGLEEVISEQHPMREPRRSARIKELTTKPVYYNSQAVAHPIQAVCSLAHIPTNHQAFLCELDKGQVPRSYEEAKQKKEWMDAVNEEIGAMQRNHTWVEEELPKNKRTVSSKWVFTIKYRSNGEIERYKARLVARGFTQTYGIDYKETFAPVAKLHTVRVVLSLATNLEWSLWQMDVKNAFLQGELEEEVYMLPPPGLEDSIKPGKVLRLKKAIYGLKQSPRAWYHKLSFTLREKGFIKSQADHSLFTIKGDKGIVVVLIYVDDIIITGNDGVGIQDTKDHLKRSFDIKDLGELKYFLGIEVCKTNEGLFLSQRKYALDLLSETGKLGAKPARTPIEENYKDTRKGEPEEDIYEDIQQYQRVVGKLIYLTITRPDISFAVNQVSQHMKAPTLHNWHMIERILKYLKGAPGKGIWMGKNVNTEIVGYCDADWAGDKTDRKSTTGFCTFVGGNLVTWRSKKQKVVARSSAEAEYRAMADTTDELTWLKALLQDLGEKPPLPITLHCDNQAAIHIASNPVFHERTKHIEVDCHHIREKIEMGIILPCYTRSQDQLADIFTKATNSKVCRLMHERLGLLDLHTP